MDKVEKLGSGNVMVDGVEFEPVQKKGKKSIQDFCRENRCWAAKDAVKYEGTERWWAYKDKPELDPVFNIWRYYNRPLSEKLIDAKLSYPDVPWDKSLVAPDGSMPLLKEKKESPYGKHPEGFEAGHWYKCVLKKRGCCWASGGSMDKVLDGKPWKCIEGDGKFASFENLDEYDTTWYWELDEFIEVPAPKERKWQPRRGDPIFVWLDGASEDIPCPVFYFHSFARGGGVNIFSSEYADKTNQRCSHYRKFDPALVGVPRKDWPKED